MSPQSHCTVATKCASKFLPEHTIFGVFGEPLKYFQISLNFVWCNNFPQGKVLVAES